MPLEIDVVGQRFNRLVVISDNCIRNRYGQILVECLCDCGVIKYVLKGHLRNGSVKSCGCYNREVATKHGMFGTKLYKVIDSIMQRCYNPKCSAYKNYGGRGIKVSDEWKFDKGSFIKWALSNGYDEGLTIDRIDNDGDYTPENCRFVTLKSNSRNRRSNKMVTYDGMSYCLSEFCEKFGLHYEKTRRYLYNHKNATIQDVFLLKGIKL